MKNIKLNPLDIPEILLLVGDFLTRKGLLNCIRVSKAFHSILISFIWRKITISPFLKRHPTNEALQKHKKFIEAIRFECCFPEEYGSLQGCDRLKLIRYGRPTWRFSGLAHLPNFVKAHNSTITMFCMSSTQTSRQLWEALLECTNLKHLEVSYASIDDEVDLFLQVCKKLRHLALENVMIHQLPIGFLSNETSEYILSNVHTLCITGVQVTNPPRPYTPSYCLGMLVRSCPELRALKFCDTSEYGRPIQPNHDDVFRTAFLQRPWPLANLSELSFPYMKIKDEDMAALLRQMAELRRLDAPFCELGKLSLQELLAGKQDILDNGYMVRKARLRRLCETIEELVFNTQSASMDGIVQATLSNCPRLELLRGPKITVTEIANGAEWVCTRLTSLAIYLEVDVDQGAVEGMEKQRIAFKRLGKLTQLRNLDLTSWSPRNRGRKRTLDLRLRAGLDELANLKVLKRVLFRGDDHQLIGLEDARWVVNNWPSIKYLDRLIDDPSIPSSVNALFYSHNIKHG